MWKISLLIKKYKIVIGFDGMFTEKGFLKSDIVIF